MNNWTAPQRPNAYAEKSLISAILDGTFPPGTTLPGERDLATLLGITRPTLREAIQRLARDGWLTVRHGKPTVVNNYWQEGGLNMLNSLVEHIEYLPIDFVPQLLKVRENLAPAYTEAAVENNPFAVVSFLHDHEALSPSAQEYAVFDWQLHRQLSIASTNPIYTLILNGFSDIFAKFAVYYFANQEARSSSQNFYRALLKAAQEENSTDAKTVCQAAMKESIAMWHMSAKRG